MGAAGTTGAAGATGSAGATGAAGHAGNGGAAGAAGTTGAAGATGCVGGGIDGGGGAAGACGVPSYSLEPLVCPNGTSWTLQITCAAPNTAVSYQCCWEDGITCSSRIAAGSTDSSGNFTLVSSVGNATVVPGVCGWDNHTQSICDFYVGCSVVLHTVSTP
jgi:pilus assembly protein FimV